MLSDEWLQRYRLLENFTAKWNGNGNGNSYDRVDYNSSFALRAVELKMHELYVAGPVTAVGSTSGLAFRKSKVLFEGIKNKKIKKLCLTSRFQTVNISSVELLLRHNK